jgi:hypothetical protein
MKVRTIRAIQAGLPISSKRAAMPMEYPLRRCEC